MSREFFSQLTTKDVFVLTTILERYDDQADAFATLLREKLNYATVYFRDDIPGDVVTLNSRVTYRLNGQIEGPHLVVQCQGEDLPDYTVSIHTIRGLSLLGLAEGEKTAVEDDGKRQTIFIEAVEFQPEANLRLREQSTVSSRALRPVVDPSPQILKFKSKQEAAVIHCPDDDDDPGPFAA
jgi:regulator of nucleoside diphosphate kinase